jgi:hypothetical protein
METCKSEYLKWKFSRKKNKVFGKMNSSFFEEEKKKFLLIIKPNLLL